jgi:hypothetical protein
VACESHSNLLILQVGLYIETSQMALTIRERLMETEEESRRKKQKSEHVAKERGAHSAVPATGQPSIHSMMPDRSVISAVGNPQRYTYIPELQEGLSPTTLSNSRISTTENCTIAADPGAALSTTLVSLPPFCREGAGLLAGIFENTSSRNELWIASYSSASELLGSCCCLR